MGLYITFIPTYVAPEPQPEPETIAYLEHPDVNILNDSTIYFSATAYQITGAEIWDALDGAVVQLKTTFGLSLGINNLSSQFTFWYPRIGGTSAAHAVDLITGATRGSWYGGVTHDPSGVVGNGSNGYFDTTIAYSSANFSQNNQSFGFISKTDSNGLTSDFGAAGLNLAGEVNMYGRNGGSLSTRLGDIATNSATATTTSLGMLSINRVSGTQYKQYQDGTAIGTKTTNSDSLAAGQGDISEMGIRFNNSVIQFSARKRTHFFGGLGMNDTQMGEVYTALNQLETTLLR